MAMDQKANRYISLLRPCGLEREETLLYDRGRSMGQYNSRASDEINSRCAYCIAGNPVAERLFLISNYDGWPIKEVYQCTNCASWGLRNRPDIYSKTYTQALVNQLTRHLMEAS
jgi:hypothetical protein